MEREVCFAQHRPLCGLGSIEYYQDGRSVKIGVVSSQIGGELGLALQLESSQVVIGAMHMVPG